METDYISVIKRGGEQSVAMAVAYPVWRGGSRVALMTWLARRG